MTQPLDWAEAFAQKRATLIAGTGYQYGDTDFLEYSERIYKNFSQQLNSGTDAAPVAVGDVVGQGIQAAAVMGQLRSRTSPAPSSSSAATRAPTFRCRPTCAGIIWPA